MTQIGPVAIVCVGAMSLAYLSGFYPLYVTLLALGVMAFVAFAQLNPPKRRPPKEPWYMRE